MYDRELVAQRLLQLRTNCSFSQVHISNVTGLNVGTVKHLEHFRQNLTMRELCSLATGYGVSVDWILGRGSFSAIETPCIYDKKNFGSMVRMLRHEIGCNLPQYADLIGTSRVNLLHIEKGRNGISVSFFCRIAFLHSVSADWVLGRTQDRW